MKRWAMRAGVDVVTVVEAADEPAPGYGITHVDDVTGTDVHSGSQFVHGSYASAPAAAPAPLAPAKLAAKNAINAHCDQFRAQFVTRITAQDVVYDCKKVEAEQITQELANGGDPFSNANRIKYRFINDEAIAKGASILSVYQTVNTLRVQWMELLYMTEQKRQGLMAQIDNAASLAELPSTNVNWATPW